MLLLLGALGLQCGDAELRGEAGSERGRWAQQSPCAGAPRGKRARALSEASSSACSDRSSSKRRYSCWRKERTAGQVGCAGASGAPPPSIAPRGVPTKTTAPTKSSPGIHPMAGDPDAIFKRLRAGLRFKTLERPAQPQVRINARFGPSHISGICIELRAPSGACQSRHLC